MPTICIFFGIHIFIYNKEHNPPHFHAYYKDNEGIFDMNGNMTLGNIPTKQRKYIQKWAILHHQELLTCWKQAQSQIKPQKIEPLK